MSQQNNPLAELLLGKALPAAILKRLVDRHPNLGAWANVGTTVMAASMLGRQSSVEERLSAVEQRLESAGGSGTIEDGSGEKRYSKAAVIKALQAYEELADPALWSRITLSLLRRDPEGMAATIPWTLSFIFDLGLADTTFEKVFEPVCESMEERLKHSDRGIAAMKEAGPWVAPLAGGILEFCFALALDQHNLIHWHSCPNLPPAAEAQSWTLLSEAGHKRFGGCCYERLKFFNMLPEGAQSPSKRRRRRRKNRTA